MPDVHAKLSLSSSARWLACPPSALKNAELPDTTSEYAELGTEAHSLCEYQVRKVIGEKVRSPAGKMPHYDQEMQSCADEYQQFVTEQIEDIRRACPDLTVLVEQRLDLSEYIPESFGTADCIIAGDGTAVIIDYKHGSGIEVSADHNTQLMCYGLGMCLLFGGIYDIDTVRMCIFQPRKNNVSIFEMPSEELFRWAEEELRPTAEMAFRGEGEFKAGPHCQFCKIKAACRKRAEYNLELAKYDFAMPDTLEDEEVEAILGKASELAAWAADVHDYALKAALGGKKWAGYKLVSGRSTRKYTDERAVAEKVSEAGYDPFEQKLLGITAMTSLLGKKRFSELLDGLIEKPPGKPTLVPASDKRPEIVVATVQEDFKE